jgi:hypothetical protein
MMGIYALECNSLRKEVMRPLYPVVNNALSVAIECNQVEKLVARNTNCSRD